jgi:RNA polymerase sigma-70 factor (ECF subfamily)
MSGTIKEKLLLYRLQSKRDPDAFTELYDLYVKRIYRFVYFKVSGKEEAEDITSEVFLKAWNYIINNKEKEIKSFSGLLYRLARNAIIDMYRRRSTQPQTTVIPEEFELSDGGKWYADLSRNADAGHVIAGLKKLKQEYQEVLTLKYVDELEADEIAEITGKGAIATRVTLHRALKKLKEILGE